MSIVTRQIAKPIQSLLSNIRFPYVVLRYGQTTLLESHIAGISLCVSFRKYDERSFASEDPTGFLKNMIPR